MADFPAMPLWTDAYLADTRHLSRDEHGAYLLLMMEAWRRPRCALPDDDALLARLTCSTPEEWARIKPAVMAFWALDARACEWTQKRLSKEHGFVREKQRKNRDAAQSRWNKTKKTDANASSAQSKRNAPTPTPTPHRKRGAKAPPKKSPTAILGDLLGEALAADVVAHRQRIRKPLTDKAAALLRNKLAKCADPAAGAEMMIERGWQGFEPEWMDRATQQRRNPNDRLARLVDRLAPGPGGRSEGGAEMAGGEGDDLPQPLLPARAWG